jgi:hypothetical protein
MSYIIITASSDKTSEQRCKDISEALWTLRRPRAIRDPRDVTNRFCGIVTHSDGRAALKINEYASIRLHAQLDTTELFESMPEYTDEKKALVSTLLAENQGGSVSVSEILPDSFVYTTQEEMEGDGWFPSIED